MGVSMKRFLIIIGLITFPFAGYGIINDDPSCKTCTYVSGSMLQYMQLNGLYSVTVDQVKVAGRQYCQQNSFLLNCTTFVENETSKMVESFRAGKTYNEGLCVTWGYCRCEAGTYFDSSLYSGSGGCASCPDGTYSGGDGETSCSSCPEPGTTSSKNGKVSIFNCYIPEGTEFEDTTGKWKYTDDCFFSPT